MVSDPLNFKNPEAKSSLETAKSRKDFAKKISGKRPNPEISAGFFSHCGEARQIGIRALAWGAT
jgi:hypothetical protein